MRARLTLALDAGALRLPDSGRIALFDPRDGADLSSLPKERVLVVEPFRPDHLRWEAAGFTAVPALPAGERFAAAIVLLPRAKALARARIAQAVSVTDGPVIVDGPKTHGIDAVFRDLRGRVAVSDAIAKAHGKLFWFDARATELSDWAGAEARVEGFIARPGVFSADAVDDGSRLLAGALPQRLRARVADLGAGWGYLSAAVLERPGVEVLHLVEADATALDCARANLTDPRAVFHWADATAWRPEAPVDCVVMNPPFHQGRAADADLGRAFITAAARVLGPQGQLFMVANRHLPYEAALRAAFRDVTELPGDARFKLYQAARPSRPRV
ncbi:MAG: class I SAM-dependent methyltransferase [Proteobacteria bacterium]|nr:class I SAM-dependent methyltransferase [Pseudomonadota bacterium]